MSYKTYPVTETALKCNSYTVSINGKEVTLDSARVSAFPFNRRWPGHQRSLDQTELVNFLSLETDEPLFFEITPTVPFEKVEIRPRSLGITPEVKDGRISFTLPRAAYFTVEPYGRHNALHIFADPVSDYSCIDRESNDVIYYGRGEHDVGMIHLSTGQTLFIDEGAVVYACIRAYDADNIRIVGRGILDNSRNVEDILYECNAEHNNSAINNAKRKHTVQIEYCKNVTIEGITVRDSLVYNIRPIACENLAISNVKLIGNWRYNSDGIDMHNCIGVHINNCFLRTFDDSVCVKGFDCYYGEKEEDIEELVRRAMYRDGKSYDVFRDVLVENCVIWNDWGKCLEIGAETKAREICDVLFRNCDIIHVTGVALDCMNVDWADVHDVVYRNISVELDDEQPQSVIQNSDGETYVNPNPDYCLTICSASVVHHFEYSKGSTSLGRSKRLTFEDIRIFGRQTPVFWFSGYDSEHTVSDVLIRNVYVNGQPMRKDGYSLSMNEFCENIIIK